MESFVDFIGSLGASIVRLALTAGFVVGAFWSGLKCFEATQRKWAGWLAGLAAAFVLFLLIEPTLSALRGIECKGAENFQDCVNQEGDYEPHNDY